MTEVSPMPEAKPKSPLPTSYEEYEPRSNSVPPTGMLIVHGDNHPGLRGPDIKGKDIDPAGVKPTSMSKPDMDEQRQNNGRPILEGSKPGSENFKQPPDNVRPENPVLDHSGGPRLIPNQPANSYRPPMTPNMQNPQMRPLTSHVGPGNPNQQIRQPYSNQPRPPAVYQPPNSGYPAQPPVRGEAPRPNNSYQNSTGQPPLQRNYPPGQSFGDLSQQNRMINPAAVRPLVNRPQMFPTNPAQRPVLDNYQKSPNMLPVRPNVPNNQNMPSANAIPANQQQYHGLVRPPLIPNASPIIRATPVTSDGSVSICIPSALDPSKIKSPSPVGNTVGGQGNIPFNATVDQNRNVKPATEPAENIAGSRELKLNPDQVKPEETAPTTQSKPENKKSSGTEETKIKEEKEPGIVHTNVKFFEDRDIAKIPLTPKITLPTRPVPPSRSATFVTSNIKKGEWCRDNDYETGVDETSFVHPNLRSITADKPVNLYGKGGRSRVQSRKGGANSSCPPTPIKLIPSTARVNIATNMSRIPSKSYKSIFEISPEEELMFFLNLAKANYNSCFERHHESRIDQASHRKENMPTANGDVHTVKKTPTRLPAPSKRSSSAHGPSTPLKSPGVPKSLPKTPDSPVAPEPLIKKVPMNKIQVGAAPSPNLKAVRSKIGSLANTTHKPGGGNVKIESHKVDFSKAMPRIAAKNDTYAPGGGDKKIQQVKLQWSAKPKVGSLDNAQHKPGGGDKKIESVKLDFKDKAKPKVGSKDNVKHVPGGGAVKIESQKLEFRAQSKVGSLDNVKHKPGGGDVKIFDDKTYLKQVSCGSSEGRASGTQSYCDLSIVSEVHSVSAPGTPHRGTKIKIKKSTTLGKTNPGVQKTTEVTVVSRSPSIERKSMSKSPSIHEVKLTYAKVASPKHGKPGLDNIGPVEVVNVPAHENAAILKPDETPVEVKNLISNFEQQIMGQKGLPIGQDGKNYVKTKPEQYSEHRSTNQLNEELNQKFSAVKEELDRVTQEKKEEIRREESADGDAPVSKFIKNEMAAHEKVGEIWREIHNIGTDKSDGTKPGEESQPPPPPPTPSVAQRPIFQPQQLPPNMKMRPPYPQQIPPGQRPAYPQQQFNMQRPPQMQMPQRPQFPQNPQQMTPPIAGAQGQRQPYPELGSGITPIRPQQPQSPIIPSQPASPNLSK